MHWLKLFDRWKFIPGYWNFWLHTPQIPDDSRYMSKISIIYILRDGEIPDLLEGKSKGHHAMCRSDKGAT